jgi:N-acetylglucosamine-6-phosphate deacetylase
VTGFLPTVVTDAPDVLGAALAAARDAHARVPGALGVHVVGPFIDPTRPGVHPPQWIRPMREADAAGLIAARAGAMVVTLAPASASLPLVARLAGAGIVVSLGHSDATAEEARAVFDAGARATTHLFNAMSQMSSRAPGVVGAALADPRVVCGLIADGEHAHAFACRAAIAAKGARGVALVSDAMPPAAGGPDTFELQGRTMRRVGNKLVDEEGRLAGAAITLLDAVRYARDTLGLPLDAALAMATSTPARLLGLDDRIGRIAPGCEANLVHLTDGLEAAGVWLNGRALAEDGEAG